MGFLRLFFALSVLIYHGDAKGISGFNFFSSSLAVYAFFVISGFYMSLILKEKYIQKNSYFLFITNRLLRIYPTYWLVLLLTIIASFFLTQYSHVSLLPVQHATANSFFYTNFGDLIRNLTILIKTDYLEINPNKFQNFTIGPTWTLGMELLFYFIAPFIVISLRRIGFFIIVSILSRYLIYHYAATQHVSPSIRFFPVLLIFFLLGALSYQLFAFFKRKNISKRTLVVITFSLIMFTFFYNYLPFTFSVGSFMNIKDTIYLLVFFPLIPFCFLMTKNSTIDRMLGELSYPVYLFHSLVVSIVSVCFQKVDKFFFWVFIIVVTGILSIITVRFFERPIDTWRQERLKTKKQNRYLVKRKILLFFDFLTRKSMLFAVQKKKNEK